MSERKYVVEYSEMQTAKEVYDAEEVALVVAATAARQGAFAVQVRYPNGDIVTMQKP